MDTELYYIEKGQGDAFIMLHGNGEDSSYFEHQIKYFSKKYHVYAIDTRGHGKSQRGNADFTISQFACDLYDFMNLYNIKKAIILGFSDGANIAMRFALEHEDRVNMLILNGGNLNSHGVKLSTQLPIEIGYRIARLFAKLSDGARKNAEMLGLMVNDPNILPCELQKIHVKTLVICGDRDMIKDEHTKLIAKNIKNSTLSVLHGDHFVANKCHDEFNLAVDEFLEG